MMEEILQRIYRLQQYATAFGGLISDAQAMAPTNSEGTDASGAIRVLLGPDGLPDSIRVTAEWQRRLTADAFGAAVVEAFQVAMGNRLGIWTEKLDDERWQFKVDNLKDDFDDRHPGPSPVSLPAALQRGPTNVTPRPLDQMAEDMLSAFDALEKPTHHGITEERVTGSSANRRITLTLTGNGIESCTADPRWVAEQTAARISSALGEALESARSELSHAINARPRPASDDLKGLFDEAIGLLNDPRRLAD